MDFCPIERPNIVSRLSLVGYFVVFGCGSGYKGPEPTYITSHGFNIFCEDDSACFPKDEVEGATNLLIDELVKQMPDQYSYDIIDASSEYFYGYNNIRFVSVKEGVSGSCATEDEPLRVCKGFSCEVSPTGWCAGLTRYGLVDGVPDIDITVAKFHSCVSSNALTHELIHAFQKIILNVVDGSHKLKPYWASACVREDYSNSVEYSECVYGNINTATDSNICWAYCDDSCLNVKPI